MTCPRCHAEFDAPRGSCPECGIALIRNISGMMKTSTVLISSGDQRSFYRSVQEVPEPMRSRLIESTNGCNSGTIVIADRAGKEQISQAIHRRTSDTESPAEVVPSRRARRVSWLAWMALAFVLTLGTVLSILFHVRW